MKRCGGCYRGLYKGSAPFVWMPYTLLDDSLRRLGQKAYQVLATHRRAEVGGDRQSAGYSSLCRIEKCQE